MKNGDASGSAQFKTLLQLGLQPHHRVLEIGCGTLNLGRYLILHSDTKRYVCVEPNEWLILSSLKLMQNRRTFPKFGSCAAQEDSNTL